MNQRSISVGLRLGSARTGRCLSFVPGAAVVRAPVRLEGSFTCREAAGAPRSIGALCTRGRRAGLRRRSRAASEQRRCGEWRLRAASPRRALRPFEAAGVLAHMDSFDLLSDLMWLPIIWFVILAWDWSSQQSCQFLARFASPHRRREWGYQ